MKQFNGNYYLSVSRKILMTFFGTSFLPLLGITLIALYLSHTFYHERVRNQFESLAKIYTQSIDIFLQERLSNIKFIADNKDFLELNDDLFLNEKLRKLQKEYGSVFSDLGFVDENGNQIAYAGPFRLEHAVYTNAKWFKNALSNDSSISDVFLGLRGHPHFIVTAQKKWDGKVYVLRATIDFESFNKLVGNIRIGQTGFAIILNNVGEFQTQIISRSDAEKNFYRDLLVKNPNTTNEPIRFTLDHDIKGVRTIYATALLKNGDWQILFQQTYRDAFSDLRRAQFATLLNFLLGSIVIVVAGIILSKNIIRKLSVANQRTELLNQQVIESGKLASLGELAAGIAHEVNNPVAIMIEEAGWIGDLLDEEEFEKTQNMEEFRRALKQIKTQGMRCRNITQKLLSFARKSDNKLELVQINELIDEVIGLSGQQAKYNNVIIKTKFDPKLPKLKISQTEIQQVMLNLINNALDAMEKNGGTIDILTKSENEYVIIRISDTGPGIPETNLRRIFDPFFTTKPVGKGTGLGLSICYGLINRMGGKIDVCSIIGKGTAFDIFIPVQNFEEGASGQFKTMPRHNIDYMSLP